MSEYRAIGRIEDAAVAGGAGAGADFTAGEALVQPSLNRITVRGQVHQVEPKVMQVLLLMAARPGHVVGREEFLDTVWAGTLGDDYLLNRAVSELRRIFGDDPRSPRYIETIRKGGYRLLAPIAPARVAMAVPDPRPAPAPGPAKAPAQPAPAAPATGRAGAPARAWYLLPLLLAAAAVVAWLAWRDGPVAGDAVDAQWEVQPLTSYVGREVEPALSPDGSRVAFVWDGGGAGGLDVYVKTVGAEDTLNLSRSPGDEHYPLWLPDGRGLLYARVDADGLAVMRVAALGGASTRVLADPQVQAVRGMAISPDGRWLAYAARAAADAPYRIVLAAIDGSERRVLTEPPGGTLGDLDPRFAPDGSYLVFVRATNEVTRDLYRTGLDGGAATRLTFDNRKLNGVAWSPDGRRLLFTSTRSGMYALWSAAPDGSDLRQLALGNEVVQQPATAAGVEAIVFEHWAHRSQLRLVDLESRSPVDAGPFLRSTRWDSSPAWSPDGQRIAFSSNRGGPHAIWVSRSDGREAVQVAGFGGAFIDNPAWSPDGRWIAFDASPDGTSAIYLVAPDGGPPRRVTTGARDARHPAWSRDGRWLYYESNHDGQWRVMAQSLDGGEPVALGDGPGERPRESADGRWLLYARPDTGGIWRMPRLDWARQAPPPATRLDVDLDAGDVDRWVPAAAGIHYVRRPQQGPPRLALFDPDSRTRRDLLVLQPGFEGWGFQVSPDQRRLLYSEPLAHESDLRMAVLRKSGSERRAGP
ncbi:hypothetical protein EIM48_11120 [Pseudoxanthomonas sp. SGNA-20]|uniref:winged helix-turn-helix domain-containing protein n=1 Tax=Pseudoxanthomonas sp. SGNA-20 TaxID=2493088 RepID=UPI000F634932|nr:LpqB family beta-propeller domain-containing protein [Pseudoxanthomonas sp. SGNA-20]RRN55304.1 hypothetical protein EIM48_11120 [Pseudoxanthomonas sp. SGNA-20]